MNTPQSPAMVEVDVTYDELVKHLGPVSANMLCRTVWKDGIDIEESCPGIKALVTHYATEAIAAERAEVVRLRNRYEALLTKIDDAWANYERMGEICPFEGQPMIYAATLEEIHEARAALATPTQGGGL